MQKSKADYDQALKLYQEKMIQDPEVVGMLATGSYAHGQLEPHSDLDVYVLLKPECLFRERGNTWINGIEIEYFKNPPQQIRAYFRAERGRLVSAHMFAHGIILYDPHGLVQELVSEAKTIIDQKPAPWPEFKIELNKYGIDDLRKDYEDCLAKADDVSARIIGSQLIGLCIHIYFGIHQIHIEKKKRMMAFFEQQDPDFAQALAAAIRNNGTLEDDRPIQYLVEKTEAMLGGRRSEEWILKGDLML